MPRTWDEVKVAMTVLSGNQMDFENDSRRADIAMLYIKWVVHIITGTVQGRHWIPILRLMHSNNT